MKILAISGSLRKDSYNTALRDAAIALAPDDIQIIPAPSIGSLPFFNPDLDDAGKPIPSVEAWRKAIREAEGVMIFTPEYAHDIPGVLKNAFDWIVGSGELVDKPVAVVTASTTHLGGEKAQERLAYMIRLLSACMVGEAALAVGSVNKKVNDSGRVTDPDTDAGVLRSIGILTSVIRDAKGESGEG